MRKQELHPRTAIINKKQKNQAKTARNEALLWLTSMFPKAFDNTLHIQPLKLGIMEDILAYADKAAEAGISKSKLREAVVIFTRRIDYLACLKAREMRIDLEGNPIMPVTEDEANRAAVKIKKRVEKSIKNSRKVSSVKTPSHSRAESVRYASEAPAPSYYTDSNLHQNNQRSQPSVLIKHKSTRAYDPNAVARLKEKLGLSQKMKETT